MNEGTSLKDLLIGFSLAINLGFAGVFYYLHEHPIKEIQYVDKPVLVPVPKYIFPNSQQAPPVLPEGQ